jgi:hypothetical protein
MLKKISFLILINTILFIFIELSVRIVLDYFNFPKFYKISNIDSNRYDFLTGYYNLPNQSERNLNNNYSQATDSYGFNLDGKRHSENLEKKEKNEFRIFIVGGSTVQGRALLDKNDPISARLEKKLNDNKTTKKKFFVINAGTTSFISVQELSLIQNRIIYALKPDLIIVLNGTNDSVDTPSKEFYLSNSHEFQRNFQNSVNNQSKSIFYSIDSFFSQNISSYFLLKKIVEKVLGIYLFERENRKYYETLNDNHITGKKEYRYYYNIKILSKLSSKTTPIITYLQPQMLPKNEKNLSENDKIIYDTQKKNKQNYFINKQKFYDAILNNFDKYEKLNTGHFIFKDLSSLLSKNEKNQNFYSDYVHYTSVSREIISEELYKDIIKLIN